jgi:IS30 family transposase
MNYKHFTIEERCCLREYYIKGKSYREIARLLGRNVSSVSRELRRNCTFYRDIPRYYPYTAQRKSNLRNSYRHRGMFWSKEVIDYIDEKLSLTWSPEQIANTPCELKIPSFKTIYRWIDEGYLRSTLKNLRRKGKTRKRLGNGGRFTTGKSIRKRDKSVYTRKEFGHWEADTVVSGKGKAKACFATLAERKTRFYIAVKIPDRNGETMANAIIKALSILPKGAVKTITCDRGSEFAGWRKIEEELHCSMYFADPYCAWQKGTNENLNGLLREFYPKGHNLERASEKTLKKNLALINARPKKVLHYQKPVDLFNFFLTKCCT